MREAKIILPIVSGGETAHTSLKVRLCDAFGGVTVTAGEGSWRSPSGAIINEPVRIYSVAAEGRETQCATLDSLAQQAGMDLFQETIYIRQFDGQVTIFDLRE
jgi:hypothetical protein